MLVLYSVMRERKESVKVARSLKNEKVDSVISKWDLDDMEDGRFLKNLRAVKPTRLWRDDDR